MSNKAPIILRVLASVIDILIIVLVYQLLFYVLVSTDTLKFLLDRLLIAIFIVLVIYPVFLPLIYFILISKFGGTVGKLITGTEIVDRAGNKISIGRAFFRNYAGYIVSGAICWLGFIWIAVDRDRRGWHDLIADTFVVVKRKRGVVTGIYGIIVLSLCSLVLTITILQQMIQKNNFYREIITDAVTSLMIENHLVPTIPNGRGY